MARPKPLFIEWFKTLGIPLPAGVNPHPFTRDDFKPERLTTALRIAAYNVWRKASKDETEEDFETIRGLADVVGWAEARKQGKGRELGLLSKRNGWRYFQGAQSDTSISWNLTRYSDFYDESFDIEDSWWRRTQRMPVSVPIVGLEDRITGERFYVMCAHTQVRGMSIAKYNPAMRKQYRQIKRKITVLEKQHPVVLVGDLNNGKALKSGVAPKWYTAFAHRIDYIVFAKSRWILDRAGVVRGIGFDHKRNKGDGPMNSDHPLVWAHLILRPPARSR